MNRQEVLFFIEYHVRTNDKIFETAAQLNDEQLQRKNEFDQESAFQTLRHMMDVDWSWRNACVTGTMDQTYLWDVTPLPDLNAVREFWAAERQRLLEYVNAQDETSLAQVLKFGETHALIWQVLCHLVNHGTQHRSELARYFTECGHSPGDLSLL